MQEYHGYHISIFGVLLFGSLRGVFVALADTEKVLSVGHSLDLSFQNSVELDFTFQWFFNTIIFAEFSKDKNYTLLPSQFSGRLKQHYDRVAITVENLQPKDSGTFKLSAFSIKSQTQTEILTVSIQNPITAVEIKKTQKWRVSTNSCDVDVKCEAPGAESVSYLWSGYKTETGAQLQFSLSAAEGAVTLNCTAINNVSSSSATEKVRCEQTRSGAVIPVYVWITVAVVALTSFILIAAVGCWLRSRKNDRAPEDGNTLYADVKSSVKKQKRSDSVANGMTVYETVDDLRVNPEMTIYAKVTLPQHTRVSPTSSAPYQQVL